MPTTETYFFPFSNSNSNLVLIEGAKDGKPGLKIEHSIIVHNYDGSYTNEVQMIFNGGNNEN